MKFGSTMVNSETSYVNGVLSRRRLTPFLVLSETLINQRASEFGSQSDDRSLRSFYAFKANSDPRLIPMMENNGVGFEVSSQSELETLLRRNVSSDNIICSNPIKPPAFIRRAWHAGIDTFVADSVAELDKIQSIAPGSKILVRLEVDNGGSEWPLDKKFGVGQNTAIEILIYANSIGLQADGITFHVGSQCVVLESWDMALREASDLWRKAVLAGIKLNTLNLGGGFPINYDKEVPSVTEILELVSKAVKSLFPNGVRIQVEPGRAMVGQAGTMVSRVIGKSLRGTERWLYLDVGVFNGLMESMGGIRYEFLTSGSGTVVPWVVAGPSCDSVDIVARDVWLPEPEIGDYVFIPSAGAYTTSYSSRFNGCRIPEIYIVREG